MNRRDSVIASIYTALLARENCITRNNKTWSARWSDHLDRIRRELLPSGSGLDSGTAIVGRVGNGVRFAVSFHHMNGDGSYDGWTDHLVTVRPTFNDSLDVTVSGRNRNQVKDHIADVFLSVLGAEMPADFKP